MDLQELLFMFFGGLGIFLFGIKYLGDGLQKVAGDGLRDLLDRFTTNPIMGVFAGIFVTILLQTSTGTTVLTIGLVNAGFMTLKQAIGVIIGANIGTTATAFIIGIKISAYALPIIAVGTFLIFFFKNHKVNNYGQVLFGFGALFLGLNLMGDGMKPVRDLQTFADLTVSMSDNPLLGVAIGTIFTVIIQSSSAAIGLLQTLFAQGALSLDAALPVLFGDNIGTTITAVLAAIGASVAAKRAALTHVIFNVIGTILVLILLVPFTRVVEYFQNSLNLNPEMTIAFAHGIFNVSNTLIQLPFIGVLAWIVVKLIPGQDSAIAYKAVHLEERFIRQSPSIALGQGKKEVLRMAELSEKGIEEVGQYFKTQGKKHRELIPQYEDAINNLDKKITDYLIQVSSHSLTDEDSKTHSTLMNTIRDLERIGDHMENIMELVEYQITNKVKFSDSAVADLDEMFDLTLSTLRQAVKALETDDIEEAKSVLLKEEQIDKMERDLRKKHIIRLNENRCTGAAGVIYVDMVSNLERVGDHAVNIAEVVIEAE
ncbi:Na/Pi cotransporter family protein [Alkalihalophilus marmarensis]|jgi:phosphate:Na+ symporter|uniref:Sodium:phosphate symporter n=1 Tax=Alkalihalophilus marmarensis DSM 21297 TaxID=1188261 RepID=U6SPR2_9BACI|nr:Na/Pi cotransporter family protein [Alkalihalophilus marmarensis]ERN52646.1 sodium:phosphate symporter [Alkalihalophilus marmarensis DSM 21297]MCM3487977.1 Na/Pi cotransporter family protein [Alkalihalophilus marmarensis]